MLWIGLGINDTRVRRQMHDGIRTIQRLTDDVSVTDITLNEAMRDVFHVLTITHRQIVEDDDICPPCRRCKNQIGADKAAMGEAEQWLKGQEICLVTLWNGNPISITPPNFVVLQITETDPGLRGDTSSGGGKPATLETGAVVRVPLFVPENEVIKVDTRTGEYVSRVKE